MIIGKINDLSRYVGMSENLDKAIDYIMNNQFPEQSGTYEIDNENVFMNLVETDAIGNSKIVYETHRKYIDLHIILNGSERICHSHIDDCTPKTEYNEEDDYTLYTAKGKSFFFETGEFYIVFPEDAHAPGFFNGTDKIKKAIVKIKM